MSSIVCAGIDIGAKTTKTVILYDNKILSCYLKPTGIDIVEAARDTLEAALDAAKLSSKDLGMVVGTGGGRNKIPFVQKEITGIGACARGAIHISPGVRTIIDVGAEEARAIRCDSHGKVIRFSVNEKCAAGAGIFTEAMSRALGLNMDEFGQIALESPKKDLLNTQCVVFAESEVVSLIHAGTPKSDISRIVCNTISQKISTQLRSIGLEENILLTGGMVKNLGFIDSLKKQLHTDLLVPDNPEFINALGAALAGTG